MGMTKEEFREYIFREDPVPEMTPEEAFQKGMEGDLSGYDAAGRACARAIYKYLKENPDVLKKIIALYKGWDEIKKKEWKSEKDLQKATRELYGSLNIPYIKDYGDWKYDRTAIYGHGIDHSLHNFEQDIVGAAVDLIDESHPIIKKALKEIGPTGFMWAWALNAAIYLLEDEMERGQLPLPNGRGLHQE